MRVDNSQIAVAQPKKTSPFTCHWFYAGYTIGIACQLLEFGDKLRLDSGIHARQITLRPLVDDKFGHSLKARKAA